ncbi:hypothetical protein HYH02_010724 [Chlamydomonas schloesseri]|uniref:Cytochrome c domain-containing protein n=1 Tax=Chlamydomonas schloesseri TaxID=2026947 RepID=A0A835THP6_9CHLO|nr:hypothetical protein HYH02_010724 [Chlamydomonas schloesseri]|eukprot:KAG2438930.1 hypothetical protein HYH02_010724 [Chlamydomonas schloesseri]
MATSIASLLVFGLVVAAAASASDVADAGSCVGCHDQGTVGQVSLETASLLGDNAQALDSTNFVAAALDPVASRRQLLQAHSREALAKVRTLLSEQLKVPALSSPSSRRRRRLMRAAKPVYATQCLYEEPPPPEVEAAGDAPPPDVPPPDSPPSAPPPDAPPTATTTTSTDSTGSGTSTATARRRLAQDAPATPSTPPSPDAPTSPPSPPAAPDSPPSPPESPASPPSPPSPPAPPPTGRCYLNPAVMGHPDFPDADSPAEIMLMRTAFWSYQCMFENKKRRCGTYRHPPYDCRWNAVQERCQVGPDFLIPRFVEFLHCRDDTTITPFWHRCYMIQVLTGDSDNCGQPDGDWARCWFFEAREEVEGEVDMCGPSEQGGVADRDAYDELVAQMRNGTWEREWFGECPTADLVYTLASACPYPAGQQGDADCRADPSCTLTPSRPTEYGRCRLRDDLLWGAIFGADSELFNMTNAAMAECTAASGSYDECMTAGSLAPGPGEPVPIDVDKFPDPNLTFIEEVTDGAAGPGLRVGGLLLAALLAVALAAGQQQRQQQAGPLAGAGGWMW